MLGCLSLSAILSVVLLFLLVLVLLVLVLQQILSARLMYIPALVAATPVFFCARSCLFLSDFPHALPLLLTRVLLAIKEQASGCSKARKKHPGLFFSLLFSV